MKVYDQQHIKNIVLLGGAKSGKTTLAETMMFEANLINRRGKVENGNTVSDFHDVEHVRGISVYATPLHTEWRNYKINIIDTPGMDDFLGEVVASLRVADTCIMLINAQQGVEVGTELLWQQADKFRKPIILAVNQLDHPKANWENSINSIHEHFGNNAVLMQYPVNPGEGFNKIIDLLKMVMYVFPENGGKPEKQSIPEEEKARAQQLHNELVEKAAENDEALMELYFEKGNLSEDEMREGLKIGMMNHELFPIFCLSALNDMGSGRMMGFIDNVAPSFAENKPELDESGQEVPLTKDGPAVLFVFRTENDPRLGKISFFKVLSGRLKKGDQLKNSTTHQVEQVSQLFVMDGKSRHDVDELVVGDIGATLKLKSTDTNQTLHALENDIRIRPIEFPKPRLRTAIFAVDSNKEEKMVEALRKMQEQDPTLIANYSRELRQTILQCQGELHLATTRWTLENIYGIEVEFSQPKIPYRETITRAANASYRHKKQSGGSGQFAEVHIRIEPYFDGKADPEGFPIRGKEELELASGGKLQFYNCITGGSIDARFIPSVMKGIVQKMEEGPLTGSPVRDIRVILYDGKMHPVDSNDVSFMIAGAMAFKEAFENAQPKLLEPIHEVDILAPENVTGEIMTDLQSRRGMVYGMDSIGLYTTIKAKVPLANLYKYTTTLRSISQGRASYSGKFIGYENVGAEDQKKIIAKYSAAVAE